MRAALGYHRRGICPIHSPRPGGGRITRLGFGSGLTYYLPDWEISRLSRKKLELPEPKTCQAFEKKSIGSTNVGATIRDTLEWFDKTRRKLPFSIRARQRGEIITLKESLPDSWQEGRGGGAADEMSPETLYHRDGAFLYIAYVMLIWAAPIPADRWHCSLWP